MSSNKTVTVRLNVGGTKYDVARSTIERYPDTMLARLISSTWEDKEGNKRTCEEDEGEGLFIDRDGLQFRFILEYMRCGKVTLPLSVSKDSVLKDFQYFGFHDLPPGAVDRSGAVSEAFRHVMLCEQKYKEKQEELELQVEFSKIAYKCFRDHLTGTAKGEFTPAEEHVERYFHRVRFLPNNHLAIFNQCLGEFGFRYVSHCRGNVKVKPCDEGSLE